MWAESEGFSPEAELKYTQQSPQLYSSNLKLLRALPTIVQLKLLLNSSSTSLRLLASNVDRLLECLVLILLCPTLLLSMRHSRLNKWTPREHTQQRWT